VDDRIQHIEEKIAHLEHHVTQQDKVMLELSDEIVRLRAELKLLVARLADASGAGPGGTGSDANERPPHY
jgi:SlyX protein